ncbi:MAG: TonB-dependent hemoglobin/transferrin/lactoferrin family receptor [Gloeomargarita sp. SRBZ-1_bins_9]
MNGQRYVWMGGLLVWGGMGGVALAARPCPLWHEGTAAFSRHCLVAQAEDIEITVTGTRTPREAQQSPSSVTVIDRQEIERDNVQTPQDLLRYQPNVSAPFSSRYGTLNFNIRGLEGNRVLLQVDGIRLPGEFELGPIRIGRDFVDLSTLKQVEILKGPGSALYGSDALGGVVTFTTVDPEDLLAITGRDTYFQISPNYTSANSASNQRGGVAFRSGPVSGVALYTRRDFREPNRLGDARFHDRQSGESNNYFGKLVLRVGDGHTVKFTTDFLDRSLTTRFSPANILEETRSRLVRRLTSQVRTQRQRVSLEYDFQNPETGWLQGAKVLLYYQNTEVPEATFEDRGRFIRRSTGNFLERIAGASVQFSSPLRTGAVEHLLTYGVDFSLQRNERPRDKIQVDRLTGAVTRQRIPENFPLKDFPDSDTLRLGIFVQDEMQIGESWSLIPGLRFDFYRLTASPDRDFLRNLPAGIRTANFEAISFSPRLGLVWQFAPGFNLFAQYARGFRAPTYDEVNSGFANTVTFPAYYVEPNPDLKAETSDGFELGFRGRSDRGRFTLAAFYNTYRNFIEKFAFAGFTTLPGIRGPVLRFRSRNAARARIYGVEFSGEYRFLEDPFALSVFGSLGYAVGDDLTNDRPLATVDPLKAVAGLRFRGQEDRWGVELVSTLVGRPRVPEPAVFLVPRGYTRLDLLGYWRITPLVSLNVGIFNLTNTKYFEYADLRNFPRADAFRVDRLAQPGTNISVGVNWQF